MRLPRLLLRSALLCFVSLAVAVSIAAASHVAPVLPLTSSPNHSHEKFSPMVFPAANYSGYDFSFADLSNCTFAPGTDLSFANFRGANLTNVNFSNSNLDNANFQGANLSFANIPCMGGADFRGAILTNSIGGGVGCVGCAQWGPNFTDNCTVGPLPSLCFGAGSFRGVVAGVVFADLNLNGQLDHGEQGVPGATLLTNLGGPPGPSVPSDSRGAYHVVATNPVLGTVSVVLPAGWILTGPAGYNFNLATCRSAQGLNFPATSAVVPAIRSTFGRVKAVYR